jgi:hypothetical protein
VSGLNYVGDEDESGPAREARRDAEKRVLLNKVPGSLGVRLRHLLAQGAFYDPTAPDPENSNCMSASFEHNLARVAAIQMRALAIAIDVGVEGETHIGAQSAVSTEEAALALVGIAATLEFGTWLANEIRCEADLEERQKAKAAANGGAS